MVSRFREEKRRMRRDLHLEMSVPALYIPVPNATPVPCTVRLWLKSEGSMLGDARASSLTAADRAEPEDRIRFDRGELMLLRNSAVVSVEAGEAYRLDFVYPADDQFQTARVVRLSAAEAADLPVPA